MTDDGAGGGLRNTIYKQETKSQRRMTPLRRFGYRMLVPVGVGIIRLAWALCRKPRIIGLEHLDAALARAPSFIPVYWHQHQLFCAKALFDLRERGVRLGFLVSPSVDGEIGAMIIQRFGGHAIRGSSSHTGARALRDYYEALVKQDLSPAITPDGPRGPRFVFKPGAILLSQMSQRAVLPMAYAASRATLFHWDKFVLPWPFTRITIAFGEPQFVPRTLDAKALAQWQLDLATRLKSLYAVASKDLESEGA